MLKTISRVDSIHGNRILLCRILSPRVHQPHVDKLDMNILLLECFQHNLMNLVFGIEYALLLFNCINTALFVSWDLTFLLKCRPPDTLIQFFSPMVFAGSFDYFQHLQYFWIIVDFKSPIEYFELYLKGSQICVDGFPCKKTHPKCSLSACYWINCKFSQKTPSGPTDVISAVSS